MPGVMSNLRVGRGVGGEPIDAMRVMSWGEHPRPAWSRSHDDSAPLPPC